MRDSAKFFEENIFAQKMRKMGKKKGVLKFIGKFSH